MAPLHIPATGLIHPVAMMVLKGGGRWRLPVEAFSCTAQPPFEPIKPRALLGEAGLLVTGGPSSPPPAPSRTGRVRGHSVLSLNLNILIMTS